MSEYKCKVCEHVNHLSEHMGGSRCHNCGTTVIHPVKEASASSTTRPESCIRKDGICDECAAWWCFDRKEGSGFPSEEEEASASLPEYDRCSTCTCVECDGVSNMPCQASQRHVWNEEASASSIIRR